MRSKSVVNEKRRIRQQRKLYERGEIELSNVAQSYASWCGHIAHGDTHHLRRSMDEYLLRYFPEFREQGRR